MRNIPELWNCGNCGSGFTQNVIPERLAMELYSDGNSGDRWSGEAIEDQKTPALICRLSALLRTGMKVLDIGCNTGALLDFAKKRGCKTFGVELSGQSRLALEKKGHRAFGCMEDVDGFFDAIFAFDLIEHLYNVGQFFDFCRSKLSNGGVVFFLTGDISSLSAKLARSKWWYLRYPEHIIFPSKSYFKSLSGFRIVGWAPAYASAAYKQPLYVACKSMVKPFLAGKYEGLPSLGPDHIMGALKKC
ncbi:MAG: class I SAM-dependent methyltransferase [Nitrospiraceae bacterium]|nr:class I SAM-dependent methyltransferase [Nitrospiraceae bacterium]